MIIVYKYRYTSASGGQTASRAYEGDKSFR